MFPGFPVEFAGSVPKSSSQILVAEQASTNDRRVCAFSKLMLPMLGDSTAEGLVMTMRSLVGAPEYAKVREIEQIDCIRCDHWPYQMLSSSCPTVALLVKQSWTQISIQPVTRSMDARSNLW
jgi:hypothetical protein